MTERGLLVDPSSLGARRALARGALDPLAASLTADLHVAAARPLFVPKEKARLTRVGGRCAVDGALLAFDPYEPRIHRCPLCGRSYDDETHYRWWIMWYQLWLAERAVHGAALGLLRGDATGRAFAMRVLDALAERYLTYPNRDNVLGPTRPFFSTYLESIWLLQLCVALDLLELDEHAETNALGARVRDRVVEPSRALIAEYDEGRSNRQVWNAAALAAAAQLLGDSAGVERALVDGSGIAAHLGEGLLADGTWYEGENYHQFAHRGLWYGVTIAARAGVEIAPPLLARFDAGFVAPLLTAFPDLTLPARRDSQWASSLRQWRWAEWCELGVARTSDERLAAALSTLYADDATPRVDTGRWRTAAESERNEPPTRLTRADLGWKSLLVAPAEVPNATASPRSVLLDAQGLAVFRRDTGRRWVGLDYGASGGGHGHPDRLNVLLVDGPHRWLDDMGTGSYVDRSLHWYRSTLAHNAPHVDGRSQRRVDGVLLAYEEDREWGWALASAEIAPDVTAERALVVAPTYVVDYLTWRADRDVTLDLPLHLDAEVTGDIPWHTVELAGAGHLEDGFDFLTDTVAAPLDANATISLRATASRDTCRAWLAADANATLLRATAPAAPGRGSRPFYVVRAHGDRGAIVSVYDVTATVAAVEFARDVVTVHRRDGARDTHRLIDRAWRVVEHRDGAQRDRVLAGARPHDPTDSAVKGRGAAPRDGDPLQLTLGGPAIEFSLGHAHYRRTEQAWSDAGAPTARVTLQHTDRGLVVDVSVPRASPTFVAEGTVNSLDNERPEINGDGVQLYVRSDALPDAAPLGWLVVPDRSSDRARTIPLSPPAAEHPPRAVWRRTADGYAITITLPLDAIGGLTATSFAFDVVVNETTPDRERRRGQLVLSGARGEFAYLQGDRHDAARLVAVRLVEARRRT